MAKKEVIDPVLAEYISDRGDETQRNFMYQHSYGAMLLIAGASATKPFASVWCEHLEDLLVQNADGDFEAYQVKTRQPELGAWVNNSDDIKKSFKRFVALNKKFGQRIIKYNFVSNTTCFDCGEEVKIETLKTSPVKFLKAVKSAFSHQELTEPFVSVFKGLETYAECNGLELFETLQRTFLKKSPARESIDTEIVATYIPGIPACKDMPVSSLNSIRDEIVQAVYHASSMKIDDPYKYLYDASDKQIDPRVMAKRVSVEKVSEIISSFQEIIFRYQPLGLTLVPETELKTYDILTQKFLKANLSDQISTMKRRTLTAENRLFEMGASAPEEFEKKISQLESVVQAECDDASLAARFPSDGAAENTDYGPLMLKTTVARLKLVAELQPEKVYKEPFDSLVGIAGLLTENCSVWWSKIFEIEKQP